MTFPVPSYPNGTMIDSVKWNAHVVAINDLDNRVGPTGVTLNIRADVLENRLGAGIGFGNGATDGTATAQLVALRTADTAAASRLNTLDGNTGVGAGSGYNGSSLRARLDAVEPRASALETSRTNSANGTWIASGTRQRFTGGANVRFPTNTVPGVGLTYTNGLFTFTKYGKWSVKATTAFGVPTTGDTDPAAGTALALRFRRQSDGATFGQNIGQFISAGFGGGTAIGWDIDVDASNNVWSVEMVPSATPVTIAADSRVAFTATYLGS